MTLFVLQGPELTPRIETLSGQQFPYERFLYRELQALDDTGNFVTTTAWEAHVIQNSSAQAQVFHRLNGGDWIEETDVPSGILDILTWTLGLGGPPGTYRLTDGSNELGKFDRRSLEFRNVTFTEPFDPKEENTPIVLSADLYALPAAGSGRVHPGGWTPAEPVSWRISLEGFPDVDGQETSLTQASDGKLFTISRSWDGKNPDGKTYASEFKARNSIATSAPVNNQGNHQGVSAAPLILKGKPCCEKQRDQEARITIAIPFFSSGPLGTVVLSYSSNSGLRTSQSFGYGWRSWGTERLIILDSGATLTYRDQGDNTLRWNLVNGNYAADHADNYAQIEVGPVEAYRLTFRDHTYIDFNNDGRVVRTVDRNGNAVNFTYRSDGHIHTVADDRGHILHYEYDNPTDGQPISIRADDPVTGRQVQFVYYPDTAESHRKGRLHQIINPAGEVTEFDYEERGLLKSRIEKRPTRGDFVVEYDYDREGRLFSEVVQNEFGRLFYNNNPNFQNLDRIWTGSLSRDLNGHPAFGDDECGRDSYFGIDEHGNTVYREDNKPLLYVNDCFNETENRQTMMVYDDPVNPRLVTQTVSDNGAVTKYVYRPNGDLRSVEDAQGNVTTYFYMDEKPGWVPNPKQEHLIWKLQRAEVTVEESPVSYPPTVFDYDSDGNLTRITDSKNNDTTMTYSSEGLVTSITDRRGHTTVFEYEAAPSRRRLQRVKTPKGLSPADGFRVTELDYDHADNIVSVTNDLGHQILTQYDVLNRPIQITDALSKVTKIHYVEGLVAEIERPSNTGSGGSPRKNYLTYDARNRVTEVANDIALGTPQTYAKYEFSPYGEITKLIRLKDGVERSYCYAHDALGRVTSATDFLGRVQTVQWESACPGRAVDTARGLRTRVGVDTLCRTSLIEVGSPSHLDDDLDHLYNDIASVRESRAFHYDELGRLVKSVQSRPYRYGQAILGFDRYGSSTERRYLYDELDRLVEMTFENGKSIAWDYDPEGNVSKVTDPTGRVTEYSYYRDNLLHQVLVRRSGEDDRIFTYFYDEAGRLEEIEYPTNTAIKAIFRDTLDTPASGFDANGNLKFLRYEKDGSLIRRFEFGYDDSNNRESMLDVTPTQAVKWEYGFDWLDRLVTVKRATAADAASLPATTLQREYVFDESDNRIFFDDHVLGKTYHYVYKSALDEESIARHSDQVQQILVYETAAGHRTVSDFVPFEDFEHDEDGNMVKRTLIGTGEEIHYIWTEFDRLERVKSSISGRMQDARYDSNGLRERKRDKNGNSSMEYGVDISTAASTPLTSTSAASSISYIQGAGGIIGAEVDGDFVYHLGDALSTVRDVVDDQGNVIRSFEFDEYGNLLSSSGSGAVTPKTWIGGLSVNDDTADSGLWNMGHRNYAAGVLGRFISRDPIGFSGSSLNLYAYPTNPVSYSDPMGLDPRRPEQCSLTIHVRTGGIKGGHAWLEVVDPNDQTDRSTLYGSYPGSGVVMEPIHQNGLTTTAQGPNIPSINIGSGPEYSTTYNLTPDQLANFNKWIDKQLDNRGWGWYDNCADFAAEGAQAAGIDEVEVDWALFFGISFPATLKSGIQTNRLRKLRSQIKRSPGHGRLGPLRADW